MGKLFSFVSGLLLLSITTNAQTYRLAVEGFVMPDLGTPVHIVAEQNEGGRYQELSPKRYKLSSSEAQLSSSGRDGYYFLLHRDDVYHNNGMVRFNLLVDGRQIPLSVRVPVMNDFRFNLYTDSIKPILNYYLNVEGTFSDGRIFPLDTTLVIVTSDHGHMEGMEWVLPKVRDFEKVTFTATSRYNPDQVKKTTLYLKQYVDPRDAEDYKGKTEDEILRDIRSRIH